MIRFLPALVLVACAPEPPPPCGGLAPAVSLTHGEDVALDLVDGQGMTLVHGPQGGWHVLFGVRVIDPDPFIELDVTVDALDARVVDNHYELVLSEHDGCTGVRDDLFGFVDVSDIDREARPPDVLAGETLTLTVGVVTSIGEASEVVEVIAERDPIDEPD